jgi:hypothetical protein
MASAVTDGGFMNILQGDFKNASIRSAVQYIALFSDI